MVNYQQPRQAVESVTGLHWLLLSCSADAENTAGWGSGMATFWGAREGQKLKTAGGELPSTADPPVVCATEPPL